MKYSRLIRILLLFTLVLGLTGCDEYETKILNAGINTVKVNSLESKSYLSWEVELENSSDQNKKLKRVIRLINGMNLEIDQKYWVAEKGAEEQIKLDLKLNTKLKDIESNIWFDLNRNDSPQKMLSIVRIPEEIQDIISDTEEKEYIVFDYYKYISEKETDESIINSTEEFMDSIQTMARKSLIEYCLENDFEGKSVEYIGNETMNDEEVEVYKITITAEELIDNEIFGEFLDDQIIAEGGLEIIFKINGEGYLVQHEGFIDLVFEAQEYFDGLAYIFDELSTFSFDEDVKVNVKLNFNTINYNFENEMKIVIPEMNEDNSIYFSEIVR